MPDTRLHLDRDKIGDFCRRYRIRRLALFASVLRDDFGPDSDRVFRAACERFVEIIREAASNVT